MISTRFTELYPVGTKDILFAQEIAFIRHRKKIEDYLKNIEKKEKNEYEKLKV